MIDMTDWTPNENQVNFMEILESYPDGATLKDIELDTGKTFATGTVIGLVRKQRVVTEDKEVSVDLCYRGQKIGKVKKSWKVYRLAQ